MDTEKVFSEEVINDVKEALFGKLLEMKIVDFSDAEINRALGNTVLACKLIPITKQLVRQGLTISKIETFFKLKNNKEMEFFQKLFDTGEVDITMRIMKKNDKLTINIMPGSQVSKIQPIIITGTPAELDEQFFETVLPEVNEVKGLISNLAAVKKEAAPNPKPSEAAKSKTKPDAKKSNVKAKKKTPEAKETSLFEPDVKPEEEIEETETDETDNTNND